MSKIDEDTIEYFKERTSKKKKKKSRKKDKAKKDEGVSLFDTENNANIELQNKSVVQFTHNPSVIKNLDVVLDPDEKSKDSEDSSQIDYRSRHSDDFDSLERNQINEYELSQLHKENMLLGLGPLGDHKLQFARDINPRYIRRTWNATFTLNAFQNIEKITQYFFYQLEWSHKNKNINIVGPLQKKTMYTAGLRLKGGTYKFLSAPLRIWQNKIFTLPYHEIDNYGFTIQIWSINNYTFNQFYGECYLSLKDVMESQPEMTLIIQKNIQDRTFEVQRLKIYFQMQEVFDFDLIFESWSFVPSPTLRFVEELKYLVFKLPKGNNAGWKTVKTKLDTGFWPSPLSYIFKGTMNDLLNSYFVVTVMAKDSNSKVFQKNHIIGKTIMSFQSVTEYPLFKGLVKYLTLDQNLFHQGEVVGNIRCYNRSVDVPYYEDPFLVKRVEQPLSLTTTVTQLDFSQQYLVVRIFKCENLPVVRPDAGTSNPLVKVKWDNIVISTEKRAQTLRPSFNQNLYFPIRLLDDIELSAPLYRKNCLPIDLLSKGNIIFECWDEEETSSDFLGGTEVHFSDYFNKSTKEFRCLGEGVSVNDSGRLPDGRPAKFVYSAVDSDLEEQNISFSKPQVYEKKYLTHVYRRNAVELVGSSIPNNADSVPCIYFEIFCIPPLPDDLQFPSKQFQKESEDLWKKWSKRWDISFKKWLKIYLEVFPEAVSQRRFLCCAEHPQTRRLHPLPAFVTPIAIAEQVSSIAELLHWLKNMTFIVSHQMRNTGQFSRWLTPNYMLASRKGGINDHAVLLCNCLLGFNYDAYVCKGTIENGKTEHCWVLIRHFNGWVTFIETTTKKRFHLPNRWMYPLTQHGKSSEQESAETEQHHYLYQLYNEAVKELNKTEKPVDADMQLLHIYDDEVVPDVMPDIEEFEEKYEKDSPTSKLEELNRLALLDWMSNKQDNLTIFPNKALLDPNTTLAYVPYSSIETVFNHQQLWGNLQNHHPALITYDLNDTALWKPFLTQPPDSIDTMVFVAPSTRDKFCETLTAEIQTDIAENIRIWRHRKGLETFLDHSTEKTLRLEKYFDLLEYKMRLDSEYDPGPPPGHQGWSAWQNADLYESLDNAPQEKDIDNQTEENIFSNETILEPNLAVSEDPAPTPRLVNKFVQPATHSAEPPFNFSDHINYSIVAQNPSPVKRKKKKVTFKKEMKLFECKYASQDDDEPRQEPQNEKDKQSSSDTESSSGPSDLEEMCRLKNINILKDDQSQRDFEYDKIQFVSKKTFERLSTKELSSEKDVLWEEFEKTFSKANISFYNTEKHCSAMEDYADFENRLQMNKSTAKPSFLSTSKRTVLKEKSAVAASAPFSTEQKKKPTSTENLNVESLGFKIKEKPTEIKTTLKQVDTVSKSENELPSVHEEEPVQFIDNQNYNNNSFQTSTNNRVKSEFEDKSKPTGIIDHRLPIFDNDLYTSQVNKWNYYYKLESLYYRWQRLKFPVRPCYTFCGFPLHLSTTDIPDIRTFLLSSVRFRKVIDIPVDGITYCVRCKTYPLMGGVISLWVFLGYEIPWSDKDRKIQFKKKIK